jgi:cytochrome c oxidase subunit II
VPVSPTAVVITVAYCVAVAIGAAVSIAVWRSTRRRDELGIDTGRLEKRERTWLFIVLAALIALLLGTIFSTPYGRSAGKNAQVVRVTAVQFAWSVDPPTVQANRQVVFYLTSTDVNHAFGVYDAKNVLQFQVQVVPGKTQKYVHTFHRPGTYTVLCLEFCGVEHDKMETTIEVKA